MNIVKKLFVGGNWKCNNTLKETRQVLETVIAKLKFNPEKVDVAIFPPTIHLTEVLSKNPNKSVSIGCQNFSKLCFGAFTGEVSHTHLSDLGIHWTLIGHSERRAIFGETDQVIADKTKYALDNKFGIVLCVGESLQERETNKTMEVINKQLYEVDLLLENKKAWQEIVIAYEPVWAIGTGKVASPEQAQQVHKSIRKWLAGFLGEEGSNATRIIYGGSVTDKNCKELIEQPDIDGFLVGGASLKSAFVDIVSNVDKAAE